MRTVITAAVVAGVLFSAVAIAQTTYDIDFTGGAETVTGTIELASGTQGQISSKEVLGYTLGSVLGDPVAFSISGGPNDVGGFSSPLSVVGNDLVFNPLPWVNEAGNPSCTNCCYTCDANGLQETAFSYLVFEGDGFNGYGDDHGGAGDTHTQGFGFTGGNASTFGQSWYLAAGTILGAEPSANAPEIDPRGALSGLTLFAGLLLILRGKRIVGRSSDRVATSI